MRQYTSLEQLPPPASWLTIGSFDGVHRGHQEIIRNLVEGAHRQDAQAVVLTFFPHPSEVLRGQENPFYLTTPVERANVMESLGVDVVISLPFTRDLANVPAFDFVSELKRKLNLQHLLVGYNFTLGRNREGDVPTLKRLADLFDYTLEVFQPITWEGEVVSSSLVRARLAAGEVRKAAELLARNYCVTGVVVPGDGRGRPMGIPTANLAVWPKWMLPANGVYAAWANAAGEGRAAVVNIGQRPTFETTPVPVRLEAHLLDFDRDLYGEEIGIEFVERLRDEIRFSSGEALVAQIHQDIQAARGILVR